MLRQPTQEELAAIARLRQVPPEQRAAHGMPTQVPPVALSPLLEKVQTS